MSTLILALALFVQATAKPDLSAVAFFLPQATAKADDKTVDEALEKFKTDYKAKEAGARATAVMELAKTSHDKVLARLGQILDSQEDKEVRVAAAKGLGSAGENKKKAAQVLIAATQPNAKEPFVLAAILEALGKIGDQIACPTVESHFKSKNATVLKAAVEAAGDLKSRGSAHPLIELLKNLEEGAKEAPAFGNNNNNNNAGVGNRGMTDDMARERERVVKPVLLKVLANLTKCGFTMAKEYEDWWRSDGAKFMSGK
jgi:hypothetical protein